MSKDKRLPGNHLKGKEVKLKDLNRERGLQKVLDPERGPENK